MKKEILIVVIIILVLLGGLFGFIVYINDNQPNQVSKITFYNGSETRTWVTDPGKPLIWGDGYITFTSDGIKTMVSGKFIVEEQR